MSDYRQVFGNNVALGLGLGLKKSLLTPEETLEAYLADPAAAFSRVAEQMIPGDGIPVPFANQVVLPPGKSTA